MRTSKIIIALVMVSNSLVTAQEFAIKKAEITSETIILHYDLIDSVLSRTYTLSVYSSKDNFLSPLIKVKGDVGLEIKPGQNKKIIWSSKEELGTSFQGDIELEIRGRVYVPFVKFDDFQDDMVIKRGRPKTMTWTGGSRQNILNFSIYKGEEFIDVIPNVANSGSYDLILPTSIRPGSGYYFMVSDSKNKDQVMRTPTFTIKRKIPLLLKIAPIALIGGTAVALAPKAGPGDLDGPPKEPGSQN